MSSRPYAVVANEMETIYGMWYRRQIDTGLTIRMLKSLMDSVERFGDPSKRSVHELRAAMRTLQTVTKFDSAWRAREAAEVQQKRQVENAVETQEANRRTWCTLL